MEGLRILIVSPHPDDAEIGAGASLYQSVVHLGATVTNLIMTDGDVNMLHSGKIATSMERGFESEAASEVLKWEHPINLGYGDSELNRVPSGELVEELDKFIAQYEPNQIFIPLPSYDMDHKVTHEACIAAVRPGRFAAHTKLFSVYAYEYPNCQGPNQWGMYFPYDYEPHQKKLLAVKKYKSQMDGRWNSLAGGGGIDALAKLRGLECGELYAERFTLIKGRVLI